MSLIPLPAKFKPRTCLPRMSVNQRVQASNFGGSEQVVDLLNDRWILSCELPPRLMDEGAWIEAFIGRMRGQTNTTSVYHFARPQPRGTVRGTLTLNASAAQGASTIVLTGCSPSSGTLLEGDMLGVSGLLLMVATDCTASGGIISVPITNALRKALTAGAAVTWDKPTMEARLLDTSYVGYEPAIAQGVTFDFGEKI